MNDINIHTLLSDDAVIVLERSDIDQMMSEDIDTRYTVSFDKYELIHGLSTKLRLFNKAMLKNMGGYYYYFEGLNTRECEYVSTDENNNKTFYVYNPSPKYTGVSATVANTYTHRLILTTTDSNDIVDYQYETKLPYCRLIEDGGFVDYYPNPISRGLSYGGVRINGHVSGNDYYSAYHSPRQSGKHWYWSGTPGFSARHWGKCEYHRRYQVRMDKYNYKMTYVGNPEFKTYTCRGDH